MDIQTIDISIAKLRKAISGINGDIKELTRRIGNMEQRLLKLELAAACTY